MNDAFLQTLGLCRRAGRAVFGFDTVKQAIFNREAQLVFTAADLSAKTESRLSYICRETGIELIQTAYDIRILGGSIGKATGIIAVTDAGFATLLKQKFCNYREGTL